MKGHGCAALLLCALLLWCAPVLAEELFVQMPEALRPFEEAKIIVNAPEDGALTVRVEDEFGEHMRIADGLTVRRGTVALQYAATSYGGMPLRAGGYRLSFELTGVGGTVYSARVEATVTEPITLLEYALPCSAVCYQKQPKVWFVDCSVTGACVVNLEIYADDTMEKPVASVRKKIANSGFFRVAWNGKKDGRKVAAGAYWCKAYASDREDRAIIFPLEIREGRPPETELAPTGGLLPTSPDDEAVWQAMMKPLVVVNIEATDHQPLYAKPSGKSKAVGSVHGQSQGLEVVEVGKAYTLVRAWRHEDGEYVEGYVPTKKLRVITPNVHYGLLIDKQAQRMTVYEYGAPIGQIRISTGLMAGEKLFRETRAGAFITTDRVAPFKSNGCQNVYAIRIDGGNLLHQVGYQTAGGKADFREQIKQLGQKASEGCVRVDCRTDAGHPLNAYWLWTHLEYGTKVLVLDDPAQRRARMGELLP